jgi:D-alanine-D-alanine ligase
MGKIVGLTYNLKSEWVKKPGEPVDAYAEFDSEQTVDKIAAALKSGGHTIKKIGNVWSLLKQVNDLGVDIVFNIAEGYDGRNRESQVPLILELHKIPFVGADALTLGATLDKVAAKKMFIADGVPTPRYFVASKEDDLKKLNTIGFPLLVKTRYEGTSKGLTDSSRVNNHEELKQQVDRINDLYKQTALVEEFISGTEFTVPVLGNRNAQPMPVAQVCIDGDVNLGDRFFTYEMVSYSGLRYSVPAPISESLKHKLQDIAIKAYHSVDCRDFGRVDFRVDKKGNPYVLEINPLPSLAEIDVFNLFPQVIGVSYEAVINQILNFALVRYNMATPTELRAKQYV